MVIEHLTNILIFFKFFLNIGYIFLCFMGDHFISITFV